MVDKFSCYTLNVKKGLDTGLKLSLNESTDLLDNKSLNETNLGSFALDD